MGVYLQDPVDTGMVKCVVSLSRKKVSACFYCKRPVLKRCVNHHKKMRFWIQKASQLEKNILAMQNVLSVVGRIIEKNNAMGAGVVDQEVAMR